MKGKIPINYIIKIILYIIILFPFIQQRTYSELPGWISKFYTYYSILSSTIIFALLILKKQFNPFREKQWLFWIFWLIYFFATLINSYNHISFVLYQAYISLAIMSFVFYASKNHLKELLISLSIIYGFYILFNWIFFMFYPNGIYQTNSYHNGHFLGDDNAIIYVALPGLICLACNSIIKHKKISLFVWFMILITEYTFLKLWAVSSIISLTILIFGIIYATYSRGPKPKNVILISICTIFIAFFGITNRYVQNFIVNILHKDITLSGRTIIWNQAINFISERPILGHGGYFVYGRFKTIANSWYTYPCHTPYLQLAIDGGIFLLIMFFIITIFAYKKVSKYRSELFVRVLAIGIGCMLINYITEYSQLIHYIIMISLMMSIENINYIKRKE